MAEPPTTWSFEEFVATRQLALQRFAYLVTFDAEDARDAVQEAFTGLYRRSRAVVIMRFWEGRSFAEIADACGCAEATARSLLHRAVTLLRTELLEEQP